MKLCECGCGQPTTPYTKNDKRIGAVKGMPARRIKGHNPKQKPHPPRTERNCSGCNRRLAINDANFFRDSSKRSGFATRCKTCTGAGNDRWEQQNAGKSAEYHRQYRAQNREQAKAYAKAYRQANREKAMQYVRAYHEKNRAAIAEQRKVYKQANPEKIRAAMRRFKTKRRLIGRLVDVSILATLVDLKLIYQSFEGLCGICDDPVGFDTCQWDHIIPVSKDGTDDPLNLQPSHPLCNRVKGNRTLEWARAAMRKRKEG